VGRGGSAGIQTKKPETQAIKMMTYTLTEKRYFLTIQHFTLYTFLQILFNFCWLSISAVLNNSWCDTGVGFARTVSISPIVNPRIQGKIQHPIKVRAPNTTMRDVKIAGTIPFHFPNHCSNQSLKGPLIPEFFTSTFNRAVRPWTALGIVPSAGV
jgi:hypothetical protein